MRNEDADQLRKQISASVFAIHVRIEQSLFYLSPEFQASSHLLWLYSPVCVEPGDRKPRRPVFSRRGSKMDLPVTSIAVTTVITTAGKRNKPVERLND